MTTPDLPPMLKPFDEAVSSVRERIPQAPEFYRTLDNDARLRALSVAGLSKTAALKSVADLAVRSTREGWTMTEFTDELSDLIEANGGMLLSPARLDLIFRNLNAQAASSGRYRQITESGIGKRRPYGRYPLGPNDAATTPVCRRLQGLVFRLDSKLAKNIWPPNHHGERHINVVTLTEEQARASGRLYESDDEFPFLEDPATGQAARVLPDSGFVFDPASMLSADGAHLARRADDLKRGAARKTADEYGLAPFDSIAARTLPRIARHPRRTRTVERAWEQFREELGFRDGEDSTIVADYAGEGVVVTRESFDRIIGRVGRVGHMANVKYFMLLKRIIEDPFESWLVPFETGSGMEFVRRYIGLFGVGPAGRLVVVIDRSHDNWLMRVAVYPFNPRHPEELERYGFLTTTKAPKRSE